MIVALAGKAFTLDLSEGELHDPALWSDAMRAWTNAPAGGGLSLRARLVLFGLAAEEVREVVSAFAPQVDYAVGPLGSRLYLLLERAGVDPRAAALAVLDAIRAAVQPQPQQAVAAAKQAPTPAPAQDDPYPGLTCEDEQWTAFRDRTLGDETTATANRKEEWRAAGLAWEQGRIVEWIAQVGERLGFSFAGEAPPKPTPTLTLNGETWAQVDARTKGSTLPSEIELRAQWSRGLAAVEAGTLADWLALEGSALGFARGEG